MQVKSSDALVVVDVQRDFCPGGALAVEGGDAIIPLINAFTGKFSHTAYTRDWHPGNHCSFATEPEFVDKSWPGHCIKGTPGAAFHPGLAMAQDALIISKGMDADKEAYSGFDGTTFAGDLKQRGVERIFVCGLATDYCVKATVFDGLKYGFDVVVIEDACRAVDNPPGTGAEALQAMEEAGAKIMQSKDLEV